MTSSVDLLVLKAYWPRLAGMFSLICWRTSFSKRFNITMGVKCHRAIVVKTRHSRLYRYRDDDGCLPVRVRC